MTKQHPDDQVPRLLAYQARHPEVTITAPGPGSLRWIARDREAGTILAAGDWLSDLLDALEWLEDDGGEDGGTYACATCGG